MAEAVESVRVCYPAVADSVPRARHRVAAAAASAGATEEEIDRVRLAVSEVVTNAVKHAYAQGESRGEQIRVTAKAGSGQLSVGVADDGCGLRAARGPGGLGIGLALVAHVSDGFKVGASPSGGVEVKMRFQLGAGEGRAGASPAGRRAPARGARTADG